MPTKSKTQETDKLQEAQDKLIDAALRWRKVDAGEIGIKKLLLCVNALAAAVDDYEKACHGR
jgi:hypothetical protein